VAPQAAPAAAPAAVAKPPQGKGEFIRVEAELGAHSATNFYKGLSGNDVIDDGGIFVSTYQIPPIGQNLIVHVSLPGGYEFEAKAMVRWTREHVGSSDHAPPGYGAQFSDITPEGRQLVYRYVRNREPLFHDDL
jgi:Tfp pilus assembly protein PilZ